MQIILVGVVVAVTELGRERDGRGFKFRIKYSATPSLPKRISLPSGLTQKAGDSFKNCMKHPQAAAFASYPEEKEGEGRKALAPKRNSLYKPPFLRKEQEEVYEY